MTAVYELRRGTAEGTDAVSILLLNFFSFSLFWDRVLPSVVTYTGPFLTPNASREAEFNANIFASLTLGCCLCCSSQNSLKWEHFSQLTGFTEHSAKEPTGLSLFNWWILFLNCQILSILFDTESFCDYTNPSPQPDPASSIIFILLIDWSIHSGASSPLRQRKQPQVMSIIIC